MPAVPELELRVVEARAHALAQRAQGAAARLERELRREAGEVLSPVVRRTALALGRRRGGRGVVRRVVALAREDPAAVGPAQAAAQAGALVQERPVGHVGLRATS